MKILMLPKYHREGPSSRYRLYNYIEYFEKRGHTVDVKPLLFNGYVKNLYSKRKISPIKIARDIINRIFFLMFNKRKYDVLIIEKELFTNLPYFLERFLLKGVTYTLDYDDAISTNYKKSRVKSIFLKNKIDKLTKHASVVTVGNRWYWNELVKARLWYLPTVVDLEAYKNIDAEKSSNNIPVIVWIGSPATVQYLGTISEALKRLSQKHDYILRVLAENFVLDGVNVECVNGLRTLSPIFMNLI